MPRWNPGTLLITVFGVWAFVLLLASMACCDEVDAARARLQEIEAARKSEPVLPPVVDPPQPLPDQISRREDPVLRFDRDRSTTLERLPRGVMVVGQFCSPCLRMENENPNLVGGPEAPIQIVQNWLANDLEQWGITPGMQLGTPYLFILDRDGKVHGLTPQGLGCVLRGYQSPEAVTRYLTLPEHGVSLETLEPAIVRATVEGAEASPETFAAVLSAHLVEASGQQEGDEPFLYGGLFDFSLDVPESWKSIGVKILTAQKLDFPAAGISIDWSGPERSFRLARDSLTISPGVKASVRKWGISYSASLDGVSFTPDLSSVTFLLTGAPDLTVVLR